MVFLIVIDGIGVRSEDTEENRNAVRRAETPNLDDTVFSSGKIKCHGESVGLPNEKSGNSEVGHLTMGSGRRIEQPYKKINKLTEEGELDSVVNKIVEDKTDKLHFVGLCSDGGVHSDIEHLLELIEITRSKEIEPIVHFISDGRDVDYMSSLDYADKIENRGGKISSIAGRHYAMDRDNNTERTTKTVNAIFGSDNINRKSSVREVIRTSYRNGTFDQYIEPTDLEKTPNIESHSKVFLFNFRDDRMIQLSRELQCRIDSNIYTMTEYEENSRAEHFVEYDIPENTLPEILQNKNIKQYRVSESEKKPHITWFFNGQKELLEKQVEFRVTESPDVDTYDKNPEMRSEWITEQIIDIDDKEEFFCVANFPNPDLVGHIGDFGSTVEAVETVDDCIGEILNSVQSPVILCSDHGNAEEMGSEDRPITSHTRNCTPISIENYSDNVKDGEIRDIAPTVIEILSLDMPENMTGESLIYNITR